MSRRSIQGIRAVVTGASSGIGCQLALELARQGARLVLTARREQRLGQLVEEIRQLGQEAHAVVGDITDAQLRSDLLEAAQTYLGGLDLLVNNAGVGAIGPFRKASEARLRRVMEVNFFAPVELIRAALPMLRDGTRPMIVNVSSVLGHRAVPNKSEYSASKFALHGFSDALRAEVARQGIDVLLVSPSTTRTEFFDNVLEKKADLPWLAMGAMPAEAVARKAVRAMRRGRQEIILTPGGKLLVWFDRLCPPLVNRLVSKFA
jgi:short-subunit dehydrogenase